MTEQATISIAVDFYERAFAAASQARWPEADRAALESLALFESEEGPDSLEVANVSNLLASIADSMANYSAAEFHARRAWEIMDRLGDLCQGPEASAIRIEALSRVGTALLGAGRCQEAEIWLRKSLELAESRGRQLPNPAIDFDSRISVTCAPRR